MQYSANLRLQSVGNRIIDSEHEKLIGIINDIGQLMLVKHDVALSVAIKILNDALHHYFVVEENIANAVNFDFSDHRMAHQALLNEVHAVTDKLMVKIGECSSPERKRLIEFLNGLLIQHIQEDSKPFKIVLDTHLYDLKPNPESGEGKRQSSANA